MIHFEHPALLYLLLIIPVFVAMYIFLRIRRKRNSEAFADSRLYAYLTPDVSNIKSHTKFAILMLALSFLIMFICYQKLCHTTVTLKNYHLDLCFCCFLLY